MEEIIKEVLNLLFKNIGWFILLIFIITQQKAIGNLISRLTNFTYKQDEKSKEIKFDAKEVSQVSANERGLSLVADSLPQDVKDEIIEEEKKKIEETDFFKVVLGAFWKNESTDEIKRKFEEYSRQEEDKDLFKKNHSIFLYFLFKEKQDLTAIDKLTTLLDTCDNDQNKYYVYDWLTLCYKNLSDTDMETTLWHKAVDSFTNQHLKTKAIISLSDVMGRDGKSVEAKRLLVNRLEEVSTKEDKFEVYQGLSNVEQLLGNNELAIFCKDKSLEYSVGNDDKLFDTAYMASQEKISGISIINYSKLLCLNEKHAMALNNIGVEAAELKLKSKAVENYTKASNLNNTLAMSNKANLLLDAGFIEGAREIAKNAQTLENPHKNIYSLLSRIDTVKENEDKAWNEIIEQSRTYQKNIRNYISAYYCKSLDVYVGKWQTKDNQVTEFSMNDQKYEASWESKDYKYQIIGEFTNSSFIGMYKIISMREKPSNSLLLLPMDEDIACFGYLSDDRKKICFFAKEYRKKFDLVLSRI